MENKQLAEIPRTLAEAIVFADAVPPWEGLRSDERAMGTALVARVRACSTKVTRDERSCRELSFIITSILANYPVFSKWILGYEYVDVDRLRACIAKCAMDS